MKKLLILSFVLSAYSFGFGQSAMDFYEAGKDKHRQQDYRGAISDYTKAIDLDNNFSAAYGSRASCRYLLADFNGAIADISMAIKVEDLDSLKSDLYITRGLFKEESGDFLGAMDDDGQSIKHFPTALAYSFRGSLVKVYLNSFDGALLDFSSAIRLDSDNSDYYFECGEVKRLLKDFKGAIADYNSAINLDASAQPSYYGRGGAKFMLSDFRGAIADINMALAFNKEFANEGLAYFVRGSCKFNIGQKESGCLDLSKAGEMGVGDAYDFIREYCN